MTRTKCFVTWCSARDRYSSPPVNKMDNNNYVLDGNIDHDLNLLQATPSASQGPQ